MFILEIENENLGQRHYSFSHLDCSEKNNCGSPQN